VNARITVPLVLSFAILGPASLGAQLTTTNLSVSFGVGSAYHGVGIGLSTTRLTPGAFTSFGGGLGDPAYGYGIYSRARGGWAHSLPYRVRTAWSARLDLYGCAAYGWSDWLYWDPWSGYGCATPSYRTYAWRPAARRGVYTAVLWRDPFSDPWGPYWAYDPWSSFWDGPWYAGGGSWVATRGWPQTGGGYVSRGPRVAVPRASAAPATVVSGPVFKEDPGATPAARAPAMSPRPSTRPSTASTRPGSPASARAPARTSGGANNRGLTPPPRRPSDVAPSGATARPQAPRERAPSPPSRGANRESASVRPSSPATGTRPSTATRPQTPSRPSAAAPARTPRGAGSVGSVSRPSTRPSEVAPRPSRSTGPSTSRTVMPSRPSRPSPAARPSTAPAARGTGSSVATPRRAPATTRSTSPGSRSTPAPRSSAGTAPARSPASPVTRRAAPSGARAAPSSSGAPRRR